MDHIVKHAQGLRGPLRSIGMDQPDHQAETRASLRLLVGGVTRLGRPELDAIMRDAVTAADGHADEAIDRLIEHLH